MNDYFELSRVTGYKSVLNKEDVPNYQKDNIDYPALIIALNKNGIFEYNYQDYIGQIEKVSSREPFNSFWIESEVQYVDSQYDKSPIKLSGILNQKKGFINNNQLIFFRIIITADEIQYVHVIPYSAKNGEIITGYSAIELTCYSFKDYVLLLKKFKNVYGKKLYKSIVNEFQLAFENAKNNRNKLDSLYAQVPLFVLDHFEFKVIFKHLDLLLEGWVDEQGTNEEYAILNLLKYFGHISQNEDEIYQSTFNLGSKLESETLNELKIKSNILLDNLLQISNKSEMTRFELLYQKINDYGGENNFTFFIRLMYQFWLFSDYPTKELGPQYYAPDKIAYDNNKILGFYNDDFDFDFLGVDINITQTIVKTPSAFGLIDDNVPLYSFETKDIGIMHVFQPISLIKIPKSSELVIPDKNIPAFFLKAIDDKSLWQNWDNALWLSIDIGTSFIGAGILLKFKHLRYLSKIQAFKFTLAGIEVTSGLLGIMLSMVESQETDWTRKLRNYLVILDFSTLGLDLLTSTLVKKAAREALDSMPLKIQKQEPLIFEHLENVADSTIYLTKTEKKAIVNGVESGEIDLFLKKDGSRRKKNDFTGHENYSLIKTELEFTDNFWEINGNYGYFKSVGQNSVKGLDDPINKGIDMVFKFSNPPPRYFICEVKYNNARLNKTITKSGGSQMSIRWIERNLKRGALKTHEYLKVMESGYENMLITVTTDGRIIKNELECTDTSVKVASIWAGKKK